MVARYLPFLDWMKAIGMALIVHGHVAAATSTFTPPAYPKQLGVAFFVFAAGFTLAGESRPWPVVVFRRTFDVLLFGFLSAVLVSVVGYLRWHDMSESNYLPLLGGLNLLLNDFPANPTTWYIGSYLHLLLFWAVALRGASMTRAVLAVTILAAIAIRAFLLLTFGPFTAYMALTNWVDLLIFGMLAARAERRPSRLAVTAALALTLLGPVLQAGIVWQHTFPFMSGLLSNAKLDAVAISALISVIYLGYTWTAFTLTRCLPASAVVSFFARNTVIIFIAHMPVYYLLEYVLAGSGWSYFARTTMEFIICFIGLAVLSELIQRVLQVHWLREKLQGRLWPIGSSVASAA